MTVFRLTSEVRLGAPLEEVFDFFGRAENLEHMTPPWLSFRIESPLPIDMRVGATIDYGLGLHGLPLSWRSEITAWEPPFRFVDEQIRGPYRLWRHEHRFHEIDADTVCRDDVCFAVPFGRLVVPLFVRRDLKRIFAFRRGKLLELFGGSEVGPNPGAIEITAEPAAGQ